jgi:signal transduction histidine kinase/PAS domain-containing protein
MIARPARSLAPRAEQNDLSLVLAVLDEGIAVYDAELFLVTWNAQYERLSGLPAGTLTAGMQRMQVIERVIRALGLTLAPEILARYADLAGEANVPTRIVLPDGRIVASVCLPMADGRFLVKARDITAEEAAEQAIRQANETLEAKVATRTAELEAARRELQQVIDALPIGVSVYDADEQLLMENRWIRSTYPDAMRNIEGLCDLTDRMREFCRGIGVFDGRTPDEVEAILAQSLETTRAHRSLEGSLPDGRRMRFGSAGLPDGQLVMTWVDVTETYRAGEVLHEAERKLAGIIEAMPVGVVVYGPDNRLQLHNNAARVLHPAVGMTAEIGEPLRKHCRELLTGLGVLDGMSAEAANAVVDSWFERLPESGASEDEFSYPDGRFVRVRVQRLADGSLVFVHVDLTEMRRAQDELARAERLSSLGVMIAGLAHEINTPIGIGMTAASHLQSSVQAIRTKAEARTMTRSDWSTFMADAETSADILNKNLRRAGELVLSFRRLSADQISDARGRIDLGGHIREVLTSLEPELRKHPQRVTVDCPPGLVVETYPGAISQIVVNLVMNSLIHAFPDNRPGQTRFTAARDGSEIVLLYEDDGVGVTEAVARRMFEPFFTTKRTQGGTGLGLSVVHALVTQRLKGGIEARRRDGGGLLFEIRLPAGT